MTVLAVCVCIFRRSEIGEKEYREMWAKLIPGINFINISLAAFAPVDLQ